MQAVLRVIILAVLVVVAIAPTALGRTDLASTYQATRLEIDNLERRLASHLAAGDIDSFMSNFDLSDKDMNQMRAWTTQLAGQRDASNRIDIEIVLPMLAATDTRALIRLGYIDIQPANGEHKRQSWPTLGLERRSNDWVFVDEPLSQLTPKPGLEVQRAKFKVSPKLAAHGLTAEALFIVKNTTDETLDRLPIRVRHPLALTEATLNGHPLQADISFGEADGRPLALLTANLEHPLKPGDTAVLKFRYSASYAHHDLGRKPIGFTEDRGFILFEAGWYPQFGEEYQMFPYDMEITVPPRYMALSNGELIDHHDATENSVYTYRTDRKDPPFFLWGRYQETSCGDDDLAVSVWTPVDGHMDPAPLSKLVGEAFATFRSFLPLPNIKQHRVVAVTRYGGYGATGCLLLHDPTFLPEAIGKAGTLEFVAHELSHSWVNSLAAPYGDPPSFLAEGLASYLGAKVVQRSRSAEDHAGIWRENLRAYARVAHRAVAPLDLTESFRNQDNRAFRAVAYQKGAYFFRELEALVGEEIVLQALRDMLLEKQDVGFALDDIMQRLQDLTDRDLTPFWQAYLHEATVPDYAIESAEADDSLHRVRIVNHGRLMPTPVDIVAYDEAMTEVARKQVVISEVSGRGLEFDPNIAISHLVIDPDHRVLQSEIRNNAYPDCQLSSEAAASVEALLRDFFRGLREGDLDAVSNTIAEDATVIDLAQREKMISNIKQALPLPVKEDERLNLYRTGDGQAIVTTGVEMSQGDIVRNLHGEFTVVRRPNGWKIIRFDF